MGAGADGSGFQLGYARSLDGLRGISILLVLVVHLHLIEPATSSFLPGGFLGVDIFFVLSGFLITSLLVSEHQASGSIRLSHFYLRRVLRLWPALVVVLLCSCLLGMVVGFSALRLTPLRIASTLFYFTDWLRAYESSQVWWLHHFWSLFDRGAVLFVVASDLGVSSETGSQSTRDHSVGRGGDLCVGYLESDSIR